MAGLVPPPGFGGSPRPPTSPGHGAESSGLAAPIPVHPDSHNPNAHPSSSAAFDAQLPPRFSPFSYNQGPPQQYNGYRGPQYPGFATPPPPPGFGYGGYQNNMQNNMQNMTYSYGMSGQGWYPSDTGYSGGSPAYRPGQPPNQGGPHGLPQRPITPASASQPSSNGRVTPSERKAAGDKVIQILPRVHAGSASSVEKLKNSAASAPTSASPMTPIRLSSQASSFTPLRARASTATTTPALVSSSAAPPQALLSPPAFGGGMSSTSSSSYSSLAPTPFTALSPEEEAANLTINMLGLTEEEQDMQAEGKPSTAGQLDDQAMQQIVDKVLAGLLGTLKVDKQAASPSTSTQQLVAASPSLQTALEEVKSALGIKGASPPADRTGSTLASTSQDASGDSGPSNRSSSFSPRLSPPRTPAADLLPSPMIVEQATSSVHDGSPFSPTSTQSGQTSAHVLPPPREVDTGTSFAAILLDGDSTLFHLDLVKRGRIGGQPFGPEEGKAEIALYQGQQAAYAISTAVYELCAAMYPLTGCPPCFTVQIMINKTAVAKKLVANGDIAEAQTYEDFCTGFSQMHDLYSFVDVESRESAAAKIREHLRLYGNLSATKMILLGSSRPSEYIPLLHGFEASGQMHKIFLARFTEGGTVDPYQEAFGELKVYLIPGLFHTQAEGVDLDSPRGALSDASSDASAETTDRLGALTIQADEFIDEPGCTSVESSPVAAKHGRHSKRRTPQQASKSNRRLPSTRTVVSTDNEWTTIVDLKKSLKGRVIRPNKQFELGDYANMKQMDPRPCHRLYITGRCENKKCSYGHHYELTESEIAAIRTLAKEMLCPEHKHGRCKKTAEQCMYGHVCPRGSNCTFGNDCWFTCVQGRHLVKTPKTNGRDK